MAPIKVPFALREDDTEVRAEQAVRHTLYLCPSCRLPVIPRQGSQRRHHFAHKVDPTRCDFLNETEAHLRAKWAVRDLKTSGRTISVVRECSLCARRFDQPWPLDYADAVLEYPLSSGHIADVALLIGDHQVRAVIEVLCQHEVEPEKAAALRGIAWAEFLADDILEKDRWTPTQDHFRPGVCPTCKVRQQREKDIHRFGRLFLYADTQREEVECPRDGGWHVNVMDSCAPCRHFAKATPAGITCTGSMESHGTQG